MEDIAPVTRISGFPTHVVRMGSGVRRALFLHCTLANAGAWTGVQGRLLDKLSMTAFDRPGHGKSGALTGEEDGEEVHRLNTSIAARLIDTRADIVAHSYGATVALRLAMEHPEKVRSLVLVEPVLFCAADHEDPVYKDAHRRFLMVDQALATTGREDAARAFHDAVNPEVPFDVLPEKARAGIERRIHVVPGESQITWDDAAGLTVPGRLEALKMPILLIEGGKTTDVIRLVSEALSARLPQMKRVVIAGAGHMSPITHPDNVAGEIAAFLKL